MELSITEFSLKSVERISSYVWRTDRHAKSYRRLRRTPFHEVASQNCQSQGLTSGDYGHQSLLGCEAVCLVAVNSSSLKMEEAALYQTLVTFCRTVRRHLPEDGNLCNCKTWCIHFRLGESSYGRQSFLFLAYFPYSEKIKVGLCDHLALCVSVPP
jgi:hypothetical protein